MKKLSEILLKEDLEEKYKKVKNLYDNPGSEGEKKAALAAMERMKPGFNHEKSIHSSSIKQSIHNDKSGIHYGHYVYHSGKKEYKGPFYNEEKAHQHVQKNNSNSSRVVLYSPYTYKWKERSRGFTGIHKFDNNAKFTSV